MVGWAGSHRNRIKTRCGLDGGMMETLLIAGACIVAIYAGFYLHLRMSLRFIAEQMANLDAKLAEALTSTIENLPLGDIPEVNPIQMMLMQLIQDNMAKNPAKIVNRSPDGQFAPESSPESEQ